MPRHPAGVPGMFRQRFHKTVKLGIHPCSDTLGLGPKLVVDAAAHDFLHKDEDIDWLVDRVSAALPQKSLPFLPL